MHEELWTHTEASFQILVHNNSKNENKIVQQKKASRIKENMESRADMLKPMNKLLEAVLIAQYKMNWICVMKYLKLLLLINE